MGIRLPTLLVHGGAWAIPQHNTAATLAGIRAAAMRGWDVLARGTAVDAVEAAVRVLEDDPVFDAGRGSVLTEEGRVEMDAVVMDGRTLKTGAVACLTAARNPVSVARAVMEQTEHCLVVGAGADTLAARLGCEAASQAWLTTSAAQEEFEHFRSYTGAVKGNFSEGLRNRDNRAGLGSGHDTVGAVAVDRDGNVAAATSTGGITFGMPGRVGDSPLVGLGCLADNELGAISATGHGESIMRMCLGSRILLNSKGSSSVADAAREELEAMRKRVGGHGGVIAVRADGSWVVDFTTERMAWGVVSSNSLGVGSEPLPCGRGRMAIGIDDVPATD